MKKNNLLKGYLKKKKNELKGGKTPRWFCLDTENRILKYRNKKENNEYKRIILLNNLKQIIVRINEEEKLLSIWKYGFSLIFDNNESLFLYAQSEKDLRVWINELSKICKSIIYINNEINKNETIVMHDEPSHDIDNNNSINDNNKNEIEKFRIDEDWEDINPKDNKEYIDYLIKNKNHYQKENPEQLLKVIGAQRINNINDWCKVNNNIQNIKKQITLEPINKFGIEKDFLKLYIKRAEYPIKNPPVIPCKGVEEDFINFELK